jgi:hypothetical protein
MAKTYINELKDCIEKHLKEIEFKEEVKKKLDLIKQS